MNLVLATVLMAGCAAAARLDQNYLPPRNAALSGGSNLAAPLRPGGSYLPPRGGFGGFRGSGGFGGGSNLGAGRRPGAPGPDAGAGILKNVNVNNGDGSYMFSYETENGIQAEEQGELRPGGEGGEGVQSVEGGFSYTGPDGMKYQISYTADENGFVPYGPHLPTPPPIPVEIQRALAANAAEEAAAGGRGGGYRY